MNLKRHIFLIGFMGCGKSSNAACLADLTGAGRLEMDQEIEKKEQMKILEIFEKHGEPYFRDLETEFVKQLSNMAPSIVSCGGGVVLREENVRLMKEMGIVVLLTATPETVLARVQESDERPILNGCKNTASIEALMETRRNLYERAADVTISTDGREVRDICGEILKRTESAAGRVSSK